MYQVIEREAYSNLFDYIRTDIIPNKKITPITSLTAKLESFMSAGGVKLMTDSTRKHIRRRLESELGDSVDIFQDHKGKLVMVPKSVSLKDVVLENQTLQRELKAWKAKSTDFNMIIDQTSSLIRSAIRQDKTLTLWPYHPSDVKNHGHISIPNHQSQTIPSWTGFNIRIRDQVSVSEDVVEYLPTINAPTTELTTVFEIFNQSELIRKELSLQTLVVVMDQAPFAKAAEITWKHKERFSNILLRMGTFHTIFNALSIPGKRFGDAGLRDICIEAELVAEGCVNGVLDGKHYNRAVRVHKYIYEALIRLTWAEFMHWVEDNVHERSAVIKSFLEEVNRIVCELDQQQLNNLLQSPLIAQLMTLWKDFLEYLRHNNGEVSVYWMSYVAGHGRECGTWPSACFSRGKLGFASQCHKNSDP